MCIYIYIYFYLSCRYYSFFIYFVWEEHGRLTLLSPGILSAAPWDEPGSVVWLKIGSFPVDSLSVKNSSFSSEVWGLRPSNCSCHSYFYPSAEVRFKVVAF